MDDHVELRVHGVSGTSAEALLGVRMDALVTPAPAGDRYVRFERPVRAQLGGTVLEGMSWGRLTSGAVTQALWLLLLPFAMVNLGYWSRPWGDEGEFGRRAGHVHRVLVRLVALGLTATIVWTTGAIVLDMVAWQCWVAQSATCTELPGLISWLDAGRGWSPELALVVGLLGPLGVVVGLGALSRGATIRYETFRGEPRDGNGHQDPDLYSPRMWSGDVLVTRLRALHTAVGLLTVGALSLLSHGDSPVRTVGMVVVAAGVSYVVAMVVDRGVLVWDLHGELGRLNRGLLWGPGLLATVLGCAMPAPRPASYAATGPYAPGIAEPGNVLVLVELLLVLALFALHVTVRLRLGANFGRSGDAGPGTAALSVAGSGLASWSITGMSVVLAFAISAATSSRVAATIGARGLPLFDIAATGSAAFVVILIPLVLLLVRRYSAKRGEALADVFEEYAEELDRIFPGRDGARDHRVQRVVRPRALAKLVSFDLIRWVILLSVVVGLLTSVLAAATAFSGLALGFTPADIDRAIRVLDPVQPVGAWLVTLVAAGLLAAGVAAWRSEKARRLVGIIWDVTCFWPRAANPFAPPCYAERAVPQLACRVAYLARTGEDGADHRVVLAGHSQGSILAIAALAQLHAEGAQHGEDSDPLRRTSLLTLGSPAMRLYAPVFPRLFWPSELAHLREGLAGRWTNLYRQTDPIGSSLEPLLEASTAGGAPGDVRLHDPVQLSLLPERSAYPEVLGHLEYPVDPAYQTCVDELMGTAHP